MGFINSAPKKYQDPQSTPPLTHPSTPPLSSSSNHFHLHHHYIKLSANQLSNQPIQPYIHTNTYISHQTKTAQTNPHQIKQTNVKPNQNKPYNPHQPPLLFTIHHTPITTIHRPPLQTCTYQHI